MSCAMLIGKQMPPVQDDRIARYQKYAKVARAKAMTANDPEQWWNIADAWDHLARRAESFRFRDRQDLMTGLLGNNADRA